MSQEPYTELAELADRACSGGVPGRESAQRHAAGRRVLLQEANRDALPGFIVQCVSMHRFVDFITLFHPNVQERRNFLSQQLSSYHPRAKLPGVADIFSAPL
ncbi:hypothetical protein [Sphingomonas bacterium]|uniref:hypothetical protein n=1 Tax=Sphingomonas bacterium TaxID=1895847 RepID=UPI00261BB449|nr:hypothetical protein [Sphingomonas bacterium]